MEKYSTKAILTLLMTKQETSWEINPFQSKWIKWKPSMLINNFKRAALWVPITPITMH
jgi:hypothetical protein